MLRRSKVRLSCWKLSLEHRTTSRNHKYLFSIKNEYVVMSLWVEIFNYVCIQWTARTLKDGTLRQLVSSIHIPSEFSFLFSLFDLQSIKILRGKSQCWFWVTLNPSLAGQLRKSSTPCSFSTLNPNFGWFQSIFYLIFSLCVLNLHFLSRLLFSFLLLSHFYFPSDIYRHRWITKCTKRTNHYLSINDSL